MPKAPSGNPSSELHELLMLLMYAVMILETNSDLNNPLGFC